MTLYEITEEFRALLALIEDEQIPIEQAQDTLDMMSDDWQAKASSVAAWALNQEALAKACGEAAAKMQARAKRAESRSDWAHAYLLDMMRRIDKREFETPQLAVKIRKNPGRVIIDDPASVPDNLMTTPKPPEAQPNKTAIKAYLAEAGGCDWAHIETTERVEVK